MTYEELTRTHDIVNWARLFCEHTDQANAAANLQPTKYRPLTEALKTTETMLADAVEHYGQITLDEAIERESARAARSKFTTLRPAQADPEPIAPGEVPQLGDDDA